MWKDFKDSARTAACATPLLGITAFMFTRGLTPPGTRSMGAIGVGMVLGGMTGGLGAAIWENTFNAGDSPQQKTAIITGTAAIGAMSALAGGLFGVDV